MRKKLFLLFALLISNYQLSVAHATERGAADQDFIAQMMERVSSKPATYAASDYQNVTVSPTMINYVIDMMGNDDQGLLEESSAQNQQLLRQLLKNVKSLRIFTASNNIDKYTTLAKQLLSKNKHTYKEFAAKDQLGDSKHIWTRQSNNNVVEIILLDQGSGQGKPLQILNLTGNFGDNFFETLMQIK